MIIELSKMTLGQKISYFRKQLGLTQSELAERISVHARHVTRLERDKMRPSSATLVQLANTFGVQPEDLVESELESTESLTDPQLLRTFQMAQQLDSEDKSMVIRIVQALSAKKRMEQALHF